MVYAEKVLEIYFCVSFLSCTARKLVMRFAPHGVGITQLHMGSIAPTFLVACECITAALSCAHFIKEVC